MSSALPHTVRLTEVLFVLQFCYYTNHLLSAGHDAHMPNEEYRHQEVQRRCMSQTTRSSFTLLPLINKAITEVRDTIMWQLRKITDFPSPPSMLVSHGYPRRLQQLPSPPVPPPPKAPQCATVNPLHSLNMLTCT